MASDAHHSGDGRIPGQASRGQERQVHHPAALGLSAVAVQIGSEIGQTSRRSYADQTGYHFGFEAVY